MLVLALLPPGLLTHLRVVLGDQHVLRSAADPAEVSSALRAGEADLLVVDPTMRNGAGAEALEDLIARSPALPVIVYTALAPLAMRLVVRLGRLGVQHVVLNRFDDEPRRFLELIERVPAQPLADMLLRGLAVQMGSVSIVVARAIEQLFRSPARVRTAQELARMAGMIPRTLYRHLEPTGLHPRQLITCARLTRVYVLLRGPEPRLKAIALALGYGDPSSMSEQLREWTGMGPREIRDGVGTEQFVQLLLDHLQGSDRRQAGVEWPA